MRNIDRNSGISEVLSNQVNSLHVTNVLLWYMKEDWKRGSIVHQKIEETNSSCHFIVWWFSTNFTYYITFDTARWWTYYNAHLESSILWRDVLRSTLSIYTLVLPRFDASDLPRLRNSTNLTVKKIINTIVAFVPTKIQQKS